LTAISVAGAIIVKEGLVLCAQRPFDGSLAGLWEFPGGKIEHGESPEQALKREIREELGCEIAVGQEATTTTYDYGFALISLVTFWSSLLDGTPIRKEHAALTWLPASDLLTLAWAPADVPAVELVRTQLV